MKNKAIINIISTILGLICLVILIVSISLTIMHLVDKMFAEAWIDFAIVVISGFFMSYFDAVLAICEE